MSSSLSSLSVSAFWCSRRFLSLARKSSSDTSGSMPALSMIWSETDGTNGRDLRPSSPRPASTLLLGGT